MLKRTLDIVVAFASMLILFPIILGVAITIGVSMGTPIFFCQLRPGRDGKPFTLYKFRTMRAATDREGNALPDAERMTSLGRSIRALSLDELPQLWNVILGDMSLVGPRPLLMEYLPLYSDEQARRHQVRPGITGWAQINGRNAQTWEARFHLDVWYIENQSFLLDLKILCLTAFKVVARSGVNSPGDATMPRFTGNAGVRRHPNE